MIYAVGDIHGCDKLLERTHRRIDADHRKTGGQKFEIYLGDYIDRGPGSARVIDLLIDRRSSASVTTVRGNHEAMLDRFLKGDLAWAAWRSLGALQTLQSYGLEVSAAMPDEDELRAALAERMTEAHRAFLDALVPGCVVGEYYFTHAGLRPFVGIENQDPEDLMWIRTEFIRFEGPFEKIVVHGHTPVRLPEFESNRINIDTAAHESGKLTCLRIGPDGARTLR